jgi:hypothetical protein
MMWLQYLLLLCNLTYQPDVGFLAFKGESTRQMPISLAACDELRGTVKTGKNDSGGDDFLPYQAQWEAATLRPETALKAGHQTLNTHTRKRRETLKNALRGPPPSDWSGTGIGSDVYGRYALGSPVDPKKLTPQRLRDYLLNVKGKSRSELINDMESIGLKLKGKGSPDGKFMEFVDRNGNLRAKIHPPDKITTYDHLHIYEKKLTPLNKKLQTVKPKDPAAHIKIQGVE